jgi:hypothetical protein
MAFVTSFFLSRLAPGGQFELHGLRANNRPRRRGPDAEIYRRSLVAPSLPTTAKFAKILITKCGK